MKFSEENQILKQASSCTMKFWNENIQKCQVLYWEFFVPADFLIKIFSNNHILEKKNSRNSVIEFNFYWEIRFRSKVHIWKKLSDSICSGKNNIVFTFRAYFKRHDFETSFFIENQSLKRNFWKKNSNFEVKFFPTSWKVFESRVFRPGGFRQRFSNNRFVERGLFLKFRFWIQYSLRNQISIKTSPLRNNVSTRFAPRTIKRFLTLPADFKRHDFVANFFIENQSLKSNLWKRKNQILKQTFSCTMKIWKGKFPKGQVLNWEFFVPAVFYNKKLFE